MNQQPETPCYYCDTPTTGRATIGIPAIDALLITAVCAADQARADRTRRAVEDARAEAR